MKYEVAVPFDACRYVIVEADSPEEAAEKAENEAGHVSICHQCTDEIEIGDSIGAYVSEDGGGQVLDTTNSGREIERLKARIAELEAALAAAQTPPAPRSTT